MPLFRRKPDIEAKPLRCPICSERVPEQAIECAMCGADLRPLMPASHRPALPNRQ